MKTSPPIATLNDAGLLKTDALIGDEWGASPKPSLSSDETLLHRGAEVLLHLRHHSVDLALGVSLEQLAPSLEHRQSEAMDALRANPHGAVVEAVLEFKLRDAGILDLQQAGLDRLCS